MPQMLRWMVALPATLLFLAPVGCSESHEGDGSDSGISLPDMGGGLTDSSIVRPDTGMVSTIDMGTVTLVDMGTVTPLDVGPRPDTAVPGADAWTPDPGTDGGTMTTDAGPPGVTCGTETCVDPQVCCVMFGGGGTPPTRTCTAPAACMGIAAACDGPEDCTGGDVCCGMGGIGGGGSTGCVSTAMCRFGRLCHVDTDCTGMDTCCAFMGAQICSPFCRPPP